MASLGLVSPEPEEDSSTGAAPLRSDRTFGVKMSHAHVTAIERGQFLYDPRLVQMMTDVGRRLSQIDYYTSREDVPVSPDEEEAAATKLAAASADAKLNRERRIITPQMTEVLLGDLEDFLQLQAIFQVRLDFLREYHELNHIEIAASTNEHPPVRTQLGWLRTSLSRSFGMLFCNDRYLRRVEKDTAMPLPPRVALPHTFEKYARQRLYGAIFDASLELANLITDVVFIAVNLSVLEENRFLFWISVAALSSSYTARLLIGLSSWRQVDWRDPRRVQKFIVGTFLGLFDPNSAFENLIKPSFKDQETLGQNIIGESSGSFLKDPASTLAKSDFNAAKMTVLTTYALLLQDIPQIFVELLFILLFENGHFEVVYWLALGTTVFHLLRQLFEARELMQDIPALRNLVNARHLVFKNDLDDDRLQAQRRNRREGSRAAHMRSRKQLQQLEAANEDPESPVDDRDVELGTRGGSFRHGNGKKKASLKTVAETIDSFFDPTKSDALGAPLCEALLSRRTQRQAYEEFMRGLAPALITEGDFFRVAVTDRRGICGDALSRLQRSTKTRRAANQSAPYRGVSYQLFNRMEPERLHGSVRSVELTDCVSVDGDTLRVLARHCPNLQKLNLSFCPRIDDDALEGLAKETCPALERIVLDHCVKVGDAGVGHLARACKANLTSLSLRNLPLVGDGAFEQLGLHCRFLRALVVERDPQFSASDSSGELAAARAEVRRSGAAETLRSLSGSFRKSQSLAGGFNRITAKGLGVLARGAGQSLETLALSHSTDKLGKAALLDLIAHLSPYVREVSLAGLQGVDSEVVAALAKRAPFLRVLRLTNAADVDDVSAVSSSCVSMRQLSLGGTSVDKAQVDAVWSECLDAQVVSFYDPRELALFYADQFDLQLEQLHSVLQARSTAASKKSGSEMRIVSTGSSSPRRNRHSKPHPTEEEVLREMARVVADVRTKVTRAHPRKEDVLLHLVNVVDYVRRARFRLTGFAPADSEFWNHELSDRDVDRAFLEVFALERAITGSSSSSGPGPSAAPSRFPSTFLSPFGVLSTTRLNLKVDFDAETYTFIVPERFRGVFTKNTTPEALEGKISPLNEVTLGRAARSTRKLVQKYWAIPHDAKYYAWAYPIAGARDDVAFQLNRDDDHASLRFVTFGGYLYFDENRFLLSASALTVGTALSFNGPFPIGSAAVARLNADKRWRPVTIESLIPQDADSMDFCYVFTGERVLPPHVACYNQHGGFAYRVKRAHGRVEGVFFALADVSDAIIE